VLRSLPWLFGSCAGRCVARLPLVAVAATMQQDPQAIMVHANRPCMTFPI